MVKLRLWCLIFWVGDVGLQLVTGCMYGRCAAVAGQPNVPGMPPSLICTLQLAALVPAAKLKMKDFGERYCQVLLVAVCVVYLLRRVVGEEAKLQAREVCGLPGRPVLSSQHNRLPTALPPSSFPAGQLLRQVRVAPAGLANGDWEGGWAGWLDGSCRGAHQLAHIRPLPPGAPIPALTLSTSLVCAAGMVVPPTLRSLMRC